MTAAPDYLRAEEIARQCGVSVRTVRRWIASKTLPSVKVGGVRLIARKAFQQMLTPALRAWSDDNPENAEQIDAYDCIWK